MGFARLTAADKMVKEQHGQGALGEYLGKPMLQKAKVMWGILGVPGILTLHPKPPEHGEGSDIRHNIPAADGKWGGVGQLPRHSLNHARVLHRVWVYIGHLTCRKVQSW